MSTRVTMLTDKNTNFIIKEYKLWGTHNKPKNLTPQTTTQSSCILEEMPLLSLTITQDATSFYDAKKQNHDSKQMHSISQQLEETHAHYFLLLLLQTYRMQNSKKEIRNLIDRNLERLQSQHIPDSAQIKHLDVSCNRLERGLDFKPLKNLITLIIDDNLFSELNDFPTFKSLQTFSANKNNFADLPMFLEEAFDRFGNLKNLSLLKNPLNPFFEGEQKYKIYQDKIIIKFPNLKTIDGCAVQIMKKQIIQKEKAEEEKYEQLPVNAVFDSKYASDQLKSVKTRSEGHRFVKNNQL